MGGVRGPIHRQLYVYIYIHLCVCVFVCGCVSLVVSFQRAALALDAAPPRNDLGPKEDSLSKHLVQYLLPVGFLLSRFHNVEHDLLLLAQHVVINQLAHSSTILYRSNQNRQCLLQHQWWPRLQQWRGPDPQHLTLRRRSLSLG